MKALSRDGKKYISATLHLNVVTLTISCSVEKARRAAELRIALADEEVQKMQQPHTLEKSSDLCSSLRARRLRQIFDLLAFVCHHLWE